MIKELNLVQFLKRLILFTLILAVGGYIITLFIPANYITPTLPFLFVFFFAVTILVHYLLLKVSQKKPSNFINYFMLLTFGKLMFFLTIILTYALVFREDAVNFLIAFFILYVFFTIFEVVQSLSLNKKQKGVENKG